MSTDQGQPSRYIFEKKEGFFDHNLSEPITDTTHVYMQKSNGTFPVKALKAKERHHTHLSLAFAACGNAAAEQGRENER